MKQLSHSIIRLAAAMAISGALISCSTEQSTPAGSESIQSWNNDRADVMLSTASDQYGVGNFDDAKQLINQVINIDPQNAAAHILSARIDIETGALESANQQLQSSLKINPDNAETAYLCGVVYQRQRQPERALALFQQAFTKAPAEPAYLLAQAEMLVDMDRPTEALQLLQQQAARFNGDAAVHDEIGLLLQQQNRLPEAIEMFHQAIVLRPDDPAISAHLAQALYANKQFTECAATLQVLLKNTSFQSRGDLVEMLGDCQLNSGHAAEALATLQTATILSPNAPGVWLSLSQAAAKTGDLNRSESALNQCIAIDPGNANARLLLGYIHLHQNRPADALRCFQDAAATAPDDPTTNCMIGYTLSEMGQSDRARGYYEQVLAVNPQDEMAMALMAQLDLHD